MSTSAGVSVSANVAEQRQTERQPRSRRTPPSDRGYEITKRSKLFQVHWFTGTTELPVDEVVSYVHEVSGASFLVLPCGKLGYRSAFQALELPGLLLLHNPGADNMPPVCVVVPGEACEALGWDGLQKLSAPFKPTRVDFAWDDFPFTPREAKRLVLRGSVRTRAQRKTAKWHEDYRKIGAGEIGETFSFGGRGSDHFLRCYNSRGFDRGELELKGDLAVAAYELLQGSLQQACAAAIGFLRRFIDFVDPATDTNKSRQELLPEWAAWLLKVEKAVLDLPPRPVDTLVRVADWFTKQVAASAALLRRAYGPEVLEQLISDGEQRWTRRHRLLLGAA